MHLCVVKVFGCLTVYSGSRLKIEKLKEINYGAPRKLSTCGRGIIKRIQTVRNHLILKLSTPMYISNLIH